MKKIIFLAICLFIHNLNAQVNRYDKPIPANPQSTFVPLTMEQMRIIAKGRAIEKENRKKRFHKYVDQSNIYIKEKKWNYALEYIKRAEKMGFVNEQLYYNKGIAYLNLNKKSKLKKTIREAKKMYYFEVVDLLTVKLNSL
ncbi:hypothetical protein [Urechidicola croceus]|uniref:Flagellar motor protein MotB n=1 Tax=Urechidicola croceus TaxID=1850246 RepID=A0A1D8P492_9FLAO|nr:hypothetical protein [Urechidicola croceus]AOW19388.1 hypothetical protein LPB138_01230 [Urechidicola croceus]